MTKAKTEAAQAPEQAASQQFESMAAFNGAAMAMFTEALQAYSKGFAAFNGEMMGFMNTRLRHDAELGRALVKCEDWSKAAELQQDWARKAAAEYLTEAGKLMEVASKAARENLETVYQRSNQAFEKLNTPAA
jgi:hypothetical protein